MNNFEPIVAHEHESADELFQSMVGKEVVEVYWSNVDEWVTEFVITFQDGTRLLVKNERGNLVPEVERTPA